MTDTSIIDIILMCKEMFFQLRNETITKLNKGSFILFKGKVVCLLQKETKTQNKTVYQ